MRTLSTSTLRLSSWTLPTLLSVTTLELTGSATQSTSTVNFVDLLQPERNTADSKAKDTCTPRLDLVAELLGSVTSAFPSGVIDKYDCSPAA